jgi:ureidoglycolate hydrolase
MNLVMTVKGEGMVENWVEIFEYLGEGYQTLIEYGEWRVAILRFLDELFPERIISMERHCETDEVFVLLNGYASLLLAGSGPAPDGMISQDLESNKLYNVKCNVWHAILLSPDASVLIIENRDTGEKNSQSCSLSPGQCQQIVELGHQAPFNFH